MNLDIRRDARALTLSPHSPAVLSPKISCIASRMATERDVEYNQVDACVLLDGPQLITSNRDPTRNSSQDPSTSQSAGQECVNPFFCSSGIS